MDASAPIPPAHSRFEMPGMRYPATPRSGPDPEILPREAARAATVAAAAAAFAEANRWRAEAYATCLNEAGEKVPDEQRWAAAGPAPRALLRITPGCGKTRAIKDYLARHGHPAVLVTPLAAEADGYANDIPGAVRRRPRTGDAPGQANQCMMQAGSVTMPDGRRIPIQGVRSPRGGNVIRDTPDQEHNTSHICHSGNCPKSALHQIGNPNSKLSPYEKDQVQKILEEQYQEDVLRVIEDERCFVHDEIPDALSMMVTTVTAQGFSDSDAVYQPDTEDRRAPGIHKTMVWDESQTGALGHLRVLSAADLTVAMEDIRDWKTRAEQEFADLKSPRALKQAGKSEKFAAYREARLLQIANDIADALNAANLLHAVREDVEALAKTGGFARMPLEATVEYLRQEEKKITMRATGKWEIPLWRRLEQMIRLPLRLLAPMVRGVLEGSAVVMPDGIEIFYERPLLTHILGRWHPVLIADGTPSPTLTAIFNAGDAATSVSSVVAEQHLSIHVDHRFTHGIPAPEQRSAAADLREGKEIADTADRLAGDRPMLILANKYRSEAVIAVRKNAPKPGEEAGWWGRHNRAVNDFIDHDVMIWDDPALPRDAQRDAWRLHRAILIRAGVRQPGEIPIGDFSDMAYRERRFYRVGEGDIQNPAREHRDPEILAFLREMQFNEKWQGICRARGINAPPEAPMNIYLCGGMAMDRLHEQGIRDEQITFRRLVEKKSHRERCGERKAAAEARVWAAAVEIGDAGGTITRDAVNHHLRADGEPGISNAVYRRVTGDPAWTERFIDQAARVGRGAAAAKALRILVNTCRTAETPELVEAAARAALEAVERCGGDASRIIEYAHRVMMPGHEHLRDNLTGWMLIDTYGASDADRLPPAFPRAPPATA